MPLESRRPSKMPSQRILILGGTAEALELAALLIEAGHQVVYSLAGVTENPVRPKCEIRNGGFGGVQGLIDYLRLDKIHVVIDATHPFAAVMSHHASDAANAIGLTRLRLERPPWQPLKSDSWHVVVNMAEAVSALPQNARVLVTTGRKNLCGLLSRPDLSGVIRTIEPLAESLPVQWHSLLDRPPYSPEQEIETMRQHDISHLLSKNAGGNATFAKLAAASANGVAVVMIDRPTKPACHTFTNAVDLCEVLPKLF